MNTLCLSALLFFLSALPALASGGGHATGIDITSLTTTGMGYFSIALFVVAYALVIFEEQLHLRKSKPVLLAAGIIWVMVAATYAGLGDTQHAEEAILPGHIKEVA